MKGFFRDNIPPARDLLLLESGSPEIFRRAFANIRRAFPHARLHLCTCWPDPPPGCSDVFQVSEYPSWRDKLRLLLSFRKSRWDILVILCSQEPIMYAWKMAALLLVPAKTLIINENGDFFWLHWQNRGTLRSFLAARWVIIRKEFLLTALRALVFPLTLLYLIAVAAFLYARRWRRLLLWKIRPRSSPQPARTATASLSSKAVRRNAR
jgi:hypothetical protein